jgi:hypothetical protein
MASGRRWEEWTEGRVIDGRTVYALACPREFAFGTEFRLPGGERFQCWDRGGKVKTVGGIPWLDLMVRTAPVPYGTIMPVWVSEG